MPTSRAPQVLPATLAVTPTHGFVVVRWHLTAPTSHLLNELAWWSGERRSEVATRLLLAAAERQQAAVVLPRMLARDEGRAPVRLRLPQGLVDDLGRQAAGQGWPVEVLVEYLAGTYLADVLARYIARRVQPLVDLTPVPVAAVTA